MATPRRDVDDRFGGLFLLGLGLGLIPMALLFLSVSWTPFCYRCTYTAAQLAALQLVSVLGTVGLWLYGATVVAGFVLLFIRRLRPVGYALLMMSAITPCAAVTGCAVRLPSPYG